jgi:hypothetical protein
MQGAILRDGQLKSSRQVFWDAKESDRNPPGVESTCIASQPLLSGEAGMSPLGTGKQRRSDGERSLLGLYLDLHPLVTKQADAGTSMQPSTPVMPED